MAAYFKYFHRLEGQELAQSYVVGLMMEGERKSVEPMSENLDKNADDGGERTYQLNRFIPGIMARKNMPHSLLRALAAKTASTQNAFIARCTASSSKINFEKSAMLYISNMSE